MSQYIKHILFVSCMDTKVSLLIYLFSALTLKAYYVLDELLIAGELQESSKKTVARQIAAQVLPFIFRTQFLNLFICQDI